VSPGRGYDPCPKSPKSPILRGAAEVALLSCVISCRICASLVRLSASCSVFKSCNFVSNCSCCRLVSVRCRLMDVSMPSFSLRHRPTLGLRGYSVGYNGERRSSIEHVRESEEAKKVYVTPQSSTRRHREEERDDKREIALFCVFWC
jgi:hypothetical protein